MSIDSSFAVDAHKILKDLTVGLRVLVWGPGETNEKWFEKRAEVIKALKEASGSLDQVSEIIDRCGEKITILSGDDSLTLPVLSVGGKGVISVIANIVPRDVAMMVENYSAGKIKLATKLHNELFSLAKAMFIETNPIPIKTAMNLLWMAAGELRLPLCEPTAANMAVIKKALADYGL